MHSSPNMDLCGAAAATKSYQSCLTLCDPRDGSPPGAPSPGFSRQEHWSGLPFPSPMHEVKSLSRVQLLVIPWTAAHQAPPSMGFSRQEYWSGVPWPVWGTHLNCSAWETGFPGSPSLVLGTVPQLVAVEERLDLSTEVWLTVRF